jgi:tetratricopeptide (TPR) repeat protein
VTRVSGTSPALKPLSKGGIESALSRAERYRLLNEPSQAESICLDILEIDPENQEALVLLLLAITDAFALEGGGAGAPRALSLLPRLRGEYPRAYYDGVIHERRARALIAGGSLGSGYGAYAELSQAMASFERAEALRPEGNDDAILRYNACVRFMTATPSIREAPKSDANDLTE